MTRFYYDLHIHSCLSPCGDNDSTPSNIAGMGELNGLDIMALCDHNTCKNCRAFFKAAERHNIVAVAGMELTTAEDVHVVCLFKTVDDAERFETALDERKIPYKTRPDIFGNQLIVDENDEVMGEEENLLINATTVSIDELPEYVEAFGGVCYPAHIDRDSNGIISVLGSFPENAGFKFAEVHNGELTDKYAELISFEKPQIITSSDAHYLWDISEREKYLELPIDRSASADEIRKKLFEFLEGAK